MNAQSHPPTNVTSRPTLVKISKEVILVIQFLLEDAQLTTNAIMVAKLMKMVAGNVFVGTIMFWAVMSLVVFRLWKILSLRKFFLDLRKKEGR